MDYYKIKHIGYQVIMILVLFVLIRISIYEQMDMDEIRNSNYEVSGKITDISFKTFVGVREWKIRILLKEDTDINSYYLDILDFKSFKSNKYSYEGLFDKNESILLLKNSESNIVFPKQIIEINYSRNKIFLISISIITFVYILFLANSYIFKVDLKSLNKKKSNKLKIYSQDSNFNINELGKFSDELILSKIKTLCSEENLKTNKVICYGVSQNKKFTEISYADNKFYLRLFNNGKETIEESENYRSFYSYIRNSLLK